LHLPQDNLQDTKEILQHHQAKLLPAISILQQANPNLHHTISNLQPAIANRFFAFLNLFSFF